jgi:2-keto-3-deoxy-L-rhamnonate aldolase RhmA
MTETFLNPIKTRLAEGKLCLGAWLMSGTPVIAEAMASLGFHWLCVDMEHGSADISQVEAVFAAAERYGAAPMVRIGALDGDLARRLLDLGTQGIIVAAVEDAGRFKDFAAHCLYAPEGRRGVGLSRCNRWGDAFEEYKTNFRPVLVPMIETAAGIEAAAGLAALPMVDALFLGPYDLSSSLGCAGDFTADAFTAAADKVRAACKASGAALGIHQVTLDPAELKGRLDGGFTLVAYGTDLLAMRHALSGVRDLAGTI